MSNLKSIIESILFVSSKPLSLRQLERITGNKKEDIIAVIEELKKEYNSEKRGFHILKNDDEYQMVSSPENAKQVSKFLKEEFQSDLTDPQLETLTIIVYRGPVSRVELEEVRGVNSGLILRNLIIRGLVEEIEDKKTSLPLYRVTMDFLRWLGINDIKALPDYERLSRELNVAQTFRSDLIKPKGLSYI